MAHPCCSSKSLLWVSLCLSPGAAAAGVALPVDCPWDPTANVAGGVECSGQLTLTRGQQVRAASARCS